MNSTRIALVLAVAALPRAAAAAEGYETSAPPVQSVLDQARRTEKPILLDFSAVW
jgi:hypothetical protein